eukprot:4248761-Prymnesium_polylepis.1
MTPQPCPAGSSSSLVLRKQTQLLVRPSAAAFGGARGSDRRCRPLAQKCSTGSECTPPVERHLFVTQLSVSIAP